MVRSNQLFGQLTHHSHPSYSGYQRKLINPERLGAPLVKNYRHALLDEEYRVIHQEETHGLLNQWRLRTGAVGRIARIHKKTGQIFI